MRFSTGVWPSTCRHGKAMLSSSLVWKHQICLCVHCSSSFYTAVTNPVTAQAQWEFACHRSSTLNAIQWACLELASKAADTSRHIVLHQRNATDTIRGLLAVHERADVGVGAAQLRAGIMAINIITLVIGESVLPSRVSRNRGRNNFMPKNMTSITPPQLKEFNTPPTWATPPQLAISTSLKLHYQC